MSFKASRREPPAVAFGLAFTSGAPGYMSAGPEVTDRTVIETSIRRAILTGMWAAILKRVTVVLAVLALLGAAPAVADSLAPAGMPGCGALMGHTAVDGAPYDPAAPEKGQPACPASAIGCAVVALPGPATQALSVPRLPALWDPGPSPILLGRTVEPNLFPPILSA